MYTDVCVQHVYTRKGSYPVDVQCTHFQSSNFCVGGRDARPSYLVLIGVFVLVLFLYRSCVLSLLLSRCVFFFGSVHTPVYIFSDVFFVSVVTPVCIWSSS